LPQATCCVGVAEQRCSAWNSAGLGCAETSVPVCTCGRVTWRCVKPAAETGRLPLPCDTDCCNQCYASRLRTSALGRSFFRHCDLSVDAAALIVRPHLARAHPARVVVCARPPSVANVGRMGACFGCVLFLSVFGVVWSVMLTCQHVSTRSLRSLRLACLCADVKHAVKRRDPTPRWRCRARGCNCVTDLFLWRPPVPASHR